MIHLALEQGSQAWHEMRATCFNASEAPAMLGLSAYQSRAALLRQKATGVTEEHDDATLARFAKGHEAEAAYRPIAEGVLGEELYHCVGMVEIDGLHLLASFDGLTMAEDTAFEHKLYNQGLADFIESNHDLPDTHWPQVEHQMIVSGCEKVLFVTSEGSLNTERVMSLVYRSKPERRAKVIAGWKQFAADLAAYEHVEPVREAVAEPIAALPALFIQAEGRVIQSNLAPFQAAVTAMVNGIKTALVTDQDFADAEAMTKHLKDGEGKLAQAKAAALAQTASLDELFRAVDDMAAMMRDKRLLLEKLVKTEKEARKAKLVMTARKEIEEYAGNLNASMCDGYMPALNAAHLAEAIKGKSKLQNMTDALNAAVAKAKIEAMEVATGIKTMLDAVKAADAMHLFPDFRTLARQPMEAEPWAAMIQQRKATEAERIAKATAEAEAKAKREAEVDAANRIAMSLVAQDESSAASDDEANRNAIVRQFNELPAEALKPQPVTRTDADLVREFMKMRGMDDGKTRAVLVEFIKFVRHQDQMEKAT